MPAYFTSSMLVPHDILKSSIDPATGSVTMQLGVAATGEVHKDNAVLITIPGFLAIPAAVTDKSKPPQSFGWETSDGHISLSVRDVGNQLQAGTLTAGEAAMYAPGSQARLLMKLDGSINLYTQASKGGTAMGAFLSPATDSIQLINAQGNGVQISNGSGGNTNGTVLFAASGGAAAASVQVLANGNISSTATKVHQIDGSSIIIGSSVAPTVNTVAINPSALVDVLGLICTAMGGFTGTGTFPGLVAAADAVTALLPLISSKKVQCE